MSLHWAFHIVHLNSLELGLFPSPAGPSATHRAAREVSKRPTWASTDRALYTTRGEWFAVWECGAIG